MWKSNREGAKPERATAPQLPAPEELLSLTFFSQRLSTEALCIALPTSRQFKPHLPLSSWLVCINYSRKLGIIRATLALFRRAKRVEFSKYILIPVPLHMSACFHFLCLLVFHFIIFMYGIIIVRKCMDLKVCNLMHFDKCMHSCVHNHEQDIEHFLVLETPSYPFALESTCHPAAHPPGHTQGKSLS